jgi:hypothetical protein
MKRGRRLSRTLSDTVDGAPSNHSSSRGLPKSAFATAGAIGGTPAPNAAFPLLIYNTVRILSCR